MFKNRVTTELVEKYLDKHGWPKHMSREEQGEKEGIVLTGWRSQGGDGRALLIDPMHEKKSLRFMATGILKAPPSSTSSDRLNGLLMAMCMLNRQIIMGKWSYDPSDGEVRFDLGVPTDDDDLSYEEFEHCLKMVVAAVDVYAPELRSLADGKKKVSEFLEENGSKMG
jgi:hypothetical protein